MKINADWKWKETTIIKWMHVWVDKEKNDCLIWMEFRYVLTHLKYKICKFETNFRQKKGFI